MKASYRWQSFVLGAIAGLTYILFIYSWKWSYWNYVLKHDIDKFKGKPVSTPFLLPPIDVLWLFAATVILFGAVSVFAHKYRSRLPQSKFLLWQLIGITAVAMANGLHCLAAWGEVQLSGNTSVYEEVFSPFYMDVGVCSFIIAAVVNTVFGSALSIATRLYVYATPEQ